MLEKEEIFSYMAVNADDKFFSKPDPLPDIMNKIDTDC